MKLPGEKLLIRLWETLAEKGVGSLLRPWQIRREGDANIDVRARATTALAQAEKDAEDIRSGRKSLRNGQLLTLPSPTIGDQQLLSDGRIEPTIDFQLLVQDVSNTTLADSIRREVNVSKALLHAEATLEQDSQQPPSETIDDDWLYRWRDCASSVSTEELQSMWGSLLAGEVKSPGSFSLRALEFLRNLSQAEAEAIARLSRFVVGDVIFRGNQEFLDHEGITYGFLLEMQQLGIVSGIEALGMNVTWGSVSNETFIQPLISHGKVLLAKHDDSSRKLTLPACQLTSIGRQILRLGHFEPHDEYLRKVGEAIKSQGFEAELAVYVKVTATEIRYFNAEKL